MYDFREMRQDRSTDEAIRRNASPLPSGGLKECCVGGLWIAQEEAIVGVGMIDNCAALNHMHATVEGMYTEDRRL